VSNSNDSKTFETSSLLMTASYLLQLVLLSIGLAILTHFWGDNLLLSFSDLTGDGVSGAGLAKVWFIFAWGGGLCLILYMIQGAAYAYDSRAVRFFKGMWISLNAGVFEELSYRWLKFFIAMITLPFFNWITFGLVEWVYSTILVPLANFCTFGALEPFLLGGSSWVLGAAIISANVSFRDAHVNHGTLGKINVWFIGMVMFYLMLNYGIQTAIAAHFLYDAIVLGIAAVAVDRPNTSTRRTSSVNWR